MSEQRSIESLVDEMIAFSIKAGGTIDTYVEVCKKSVDEALDKLDGSMEAQRIYDDAEDFLKIARQRQAEQK